MENWYTYHHNAAPRFLHLHWTLVDSMILHLHFTFVVDLNLLPIFIVFYCAKDTLLHVLCVICVTTHIFLKYILYNYSRRNFWKWSAVVSLFTSSSAPLTLCFLIHQSRQSRGVVTFTSLQQHSAHTPYERHVSGLHTSEDNGLEMLSHIKQAHVFLPDTFGCVTKKGQNRINCR